MKAFVSTIDIRPQRGIDFEFELGRERYEERFMLPSVSFVLHRHRDTDFCVRRRGCLGLALMSCNVVINGSFLRMLHFTEG